MRSGLLLVLVLSCAGCQRERGVTPESTAKPDVILITIDTLRADKISPYGYSKPTPAFDAFAKDSVVYERAWSQVPLTLPSHASILTGLYPAAHGVRENSGFVLQAGPRTLAEALKSNGYSTAAFVGAFVLDGRFGLKRGFDLYYDDFESGTLDDVKLGIQERRAGAVLKKARGWLERTAGPLFVWIHLYDPHAPYEPPPPWDREPDPYDGEVRYVDSCIGEFFRFLRDRGSYESSLIVVTSDHGEGLGDHGEETHGMFLYESTLRVPLLIKHPGGSDAGRRVRASARLIDIFPTILASLEIKDSADVQGRPLLPSDSAEPDPRNLAETRLPYLGYGWSPLNAIIEGNFKYIDAPRAELYDLGKDAAEQDNLVGRDSATADRLKSRLVETAARLRTRENAVPAGTDPATAVRLRSLGYLAAGRQRDRAPAGGLADPKDKIAIFESIWKAEKQLAAGDRSQAATALESIVAQDPRVYLAHWLLGLAYYQQDRFADALARFNAAALLRPDESRPLMYAGMSAMRLGRLPEARKALEKAAALQPDDDAVLNNLAAVCLQAREFEQATELFMRLTKQNPSDVAAWSNLGVARLYRKDLNGAHEAFQRALALKPDQPEIHNNLGMVLAERGDVDAAIAAYRRAIEIRPDYGRAHYNLGLALQKKGLREEAAREFAVARQSGR